MVSEPRYYTDIGAVEELTDPKDVTVRLGVGWELLKISERLKSEVWEGHPIQTQSLIYVLGLRRAAQSQATAPPRAEAQAAGPAKPAEDTLEQKLENLPWIRATSGKCDFVKTEGLPKELVAGVPVKDGLKGASHHFTRTSDGSTLFRFAKKGGSA